MRRRTDRADSVHNDPDERRRLAQQEIAELRAGLGSIRYYAPNRLIAQVEEERVRRRIAELESLL